MSLVQEETFDEPVFMPFKFRADRGDCAEQAGAINVSQSAYAENISFRVGNRFWIRHAP